MMQFSNKIESFSLVNIRDFVINIVAYVYANIDGSVGNINSKYPIRAYFSDIIINRQGLFSTLSTNNSSLHVFRFNFKLEMEQKLGEWSTDNN